MPSQHIGRIGERRRIILAGNEGAARIINANSAIALGVLAPPVDRNVEIANPSPSQGGAVLRVERNRLFEKGQGLEDSLLSQRPEKRLGTQAQIVCGKIDRRPTDRALDFTGLQRRLDDAGNIAGHLVLEGEYI